MPAYNNTLGGIFVRIRLYFHGKKCLSSPKKTFLFMKVICCVQSNGDAAYRFLIRFKLNVLCIITLTKFANKLRRSTHRRCLRNYQCSIFNNPPSSPCLCVTLLQTLNTSRKPYHSKILKTQPFHFKTSKISADKDLKNHYIS